MNAYLKKLADQAKPDRLVQIPDIIIYKYVYD